MVHVDGDVLGDDFFHEGNKALGNPAKDDARIRSPVGIRQLENEIGRTGDLPALHRRPKELLFRVEMPQHGGGRDAELAGDVGEGRGLEAFGGEDAPCRFQQFVLGDSRRPAHL